MRMADVNWTRGFSRLCLLAVVGWFAYWLVWVELEEVHRWQQRAIVTHDSADWSQANLVAQWGAFLQEIVRAPVATIGFLLLPPIVG